MNKKIIIAALLGISLHTHASEQGYTIGAPHSIGIYFGEGAHTNLYATDGGERQKGAGGLFEIRYQFIPKNWGLGIGIQAASYHGSIVVNHGYTQEFFHQDNNLTYTLNTRFKNWKERQDILCVEMPILLQYRKAFSEKWGISWGLGAVFSLPIKGHYQTTGGEFATTGYFESTNIEYEDLLNHGFRTDRSNQSESIDNLKKNIGAMFELGFNRAMGRASSFYLGFYLHYGFTNSIEPKSNHLMEEQVYQGAYGSNLTEKIHPFKTGVKLGFQFGAKEENQEGEEKTSGKSKQTQMPEVTK